MSRQPRYRTIRHQRRLGCGHVVPPGTTIVRKRRTWLCPACQPWLRVKTLEQIFAEAAASD